MSIDLVPDSLQIYFAWDDGLRREVSDGSGAEPPVIYTDNCESTSGVEVQRRRYVVEPEKFGETYSSLGWEATDVADEIRIPAEKPEVEVEVREAEDDRDGQGDVVEFRVLPVVDGDHEYHVEFSPKAESGHLYTNWVNIYFTVDGIREVVERLSRDVDTVDDFPERSTETKDRQRERMVYYPVPVASYRFSLGGFDHASDYLLNAGYDDPLPSLVYDSDCSEIRPFVKCGVVETRSDDGFWERERQVVLKLAQPTVVASGKSTTKPKGRLVKDGSTENRFAVDAQGLYKALLRLFSSFEG